MRNKILTKALHYFVSQFERTESDQIAKAEKAIQIEKNNTIKVIMQLIEEPRSLGRNSESKSDIEILTETQKNKFKN